VLDDIGRIAAEKLLGHEDLQRVSTTGYCPSPEPLVVELEQK
jgi:hypothetical protein